MNWQEKLKESFFDCSTRTVSADNLGELVKHILTESKKAIYLEDLDECLAQAEKNALKQIKYFEKSKSKIREKAQEYWLGKLHLIKMLRENIKEVEKK